MLNTPITRMRPESVTKEQLGRCLGVTTRTIERWESEGLPREHRSHGGKNKGNRYCLVKAVAWLKSRAIKKELKRVKHIRRRERSEAYLERYRQKTATLRGRKTESNQGQR